MHIPLSRPDIGPEEIRLVNEVLQSDYLSLGPKLPEFEQKVADYIGVKHAIAVNSGTSGLHLGIRSLDIKDGDEVITTPFSFIASSNCILFERGKPVFVDIDPISLNIDPQLIEAAITPRTKAILPVHAFGQCCDMDVIKEIAQRYNLFIIEDACEALGGKFKGEKAGSFGHVGVFAFYPNKQMTTGEGGIIVTNNDEIARLCKCMRNQGRSPDSDAWLAHEMLGYNYRLDELSCALGIAQLDRLDTILAKREEVAQKYNEILAKVEGIEIPIIDKEVTMSWFVYVVKINRGINRDKTIKYLHDKGIQCRPYFTPIHLQPFYRRMFGYKPGDFPVCEDISERTIALPFYNKLHETQIERVCECLRDAIMRNRVQD